MSTLRDFLLKFTSDSFNKKEIVDRALNIVKSTGQTAGLKAIGFASSKLSPKSKQIFSKITALPTGSETIRAVEIPDLVTHLNQRQ